MGIFNLLIDDTAINQIERALQSLKNPVVARAISRSINKVLRGVATDLSRSVPRSYNVRMRDVTRSFAVRSAAVGRLEATAVSTGRTLPLSVFGLSPVKPGTRKGVSVKVGKQRKRIGGKYFVGAMERGHAGLAQVGVYSRVGLDRFPIKEVYGPSIPQMVGNTALEDITIERSVVTRFRRVFPQELNFELQKMGLR